MNDEDAENLGHLQAIAERGRADRIAKHLSLSYHDQVKISYGEMTAEVDAAIADLIVECWRAGITTYMSCENYMSDDDGKSWGEFSDHVWISFPDPESAQLFAETAGTNADMTVRAGWKPDSIRLVDEPGAPVMHNIFFPVQDYERALQAMKDHNQGAGA